MKNFTLIICLLIGLNGFAQSIGNTHFSSNTLEGWENTDGSTDNLTLEPNPPFSDPFLRKTCDGSATVTGEMAIQNSTYFNLTTTGVGAISGGVKNLNDFDLHLRIGFVDSDGTKIVSTNADIINPTNFSFVNFPAAVPNLYTLIEGPNSIEDVLNDVVETRIIHNEAISFDGAFVTGTLDIIGIDTVFLGTDDNATSFVTLYPNPAKDRLTLSLETIDTANVIIYNILGNKILETSITGSSSQLNIETFSAGVYLMNFVAIDGQKQTLKFIKE